MDIALIERILRMSNMPYRTILEPQSGYRNICTPVELQDGQCINIILYKNEPGILRTIEEADKVSSYLWDCGMPVRRRLRPIIKLASPASIRYAGIYNYLPGTTISWEAYTRKHMKALGKYMGDMHRSSAHYPSSINTSAAVSNHYLAMNMVRYVSLAGVQTALVTKLGVRLDISMIKKLAAVLMICDSLPQQQVLHMDFVRGNILFNSSDASESRCDISGLLDFEKAAYGHPIFDIARTMAFLMVDCKYSSHAKIHEHFLITGYCRQASSQLHIPVIVYKQQSIHTLDALIDWFLLHDFYKFLKHTPYESLASNEHYLRTRNILHERKMIHYSQ